MAQKKYMCLHIMAFGLACGVLWSITIVFISLLAVYAGMAGSMVSLLSSIYIGYEATLIGTVFGAAWAFLDAFIGGALLALLYNFFCCKCICKHQKD